MIDTPLLEARGVSRRATSTGAWLLRGASFAVPPGARLAIVGPTGSGKTVLLRALARLDPVDAGDVLWRGLPVRGTAVPEFRRRAIYLQQRPALLEGSVEDNLRLPYTLRSHGSRGFRRDVVLSLLEQVHRDETFLERSSRDLSGGEAQIVALVRAIQLEPDLLFLDEPTAALDAALTRTIEALVDRWFQQSAVERAFVWVSHDVEQVARISGGTLRIEEGVLQPDQGEESEARS